MKALILLGEIRESKTRRGNYLAFQLKVENRIDYLWKFLSPHSPEFQIFFNQVQKCGLGHSLDEIITIPMLLRGCQIEVSIKKQDYQGRQYDHVTIEKNND